MAGNGPVEMMRWILNIVVAVVMLTWFSWALGAQETFETLKVGSRTYSNVRVVNRTPLDIYIAHDGGFSNLKVHELDPEILAALGYEVQPARSTVPALDFSSLQKNPRIQAVQKELAARLEGSVLRMNQTTVAGMLVAGFVIYLFFCYCSLLICRRTGNEAGILIWIPGLQMFPLLRAAGMSGWWFILLLLPFLNLVASIVWCLKIAQACGKSALVGILLMLPLVGLFAYLYLAFSGGDEEEDSLQPIKLNLSQS